MRERTAASDAGGAGDRSGLARSVFTSRAIFIESPDGMAPRGFPEDAPEITALSRFYRVAWIRSECVPAFIRENAIEWYASWFIGEAPGIGFRGVFPAGSAAAVRRALRSIAKAEAHSRIIVDPEKLRQVADGLRKRGRRIVLTNGVFDLLHPGHLRLLENARALGGALIAAINSDTSARLIKGSGRPIIPQFARAEILTGLRAVDFCFIFTEADPLETLRIVRPAVLAKGAEYPMSRIVGAKFVASYGGEVVRLPMVQGWSTTSMIGNISVRGRGATVDTR